MAEQLDLLEAFSERDLEDFEENIVWRAFIQTIKDPRFAKTIQKYGLEL